MTIPEEIEQLKTQLAQTTDEQAEAKIILELLQKYTSIDSPDSQPFISRMLQLADKLNEPLYKAYGLYHLAVFKRNKSEYDASIDLSTQAIVLFEQVNEKKGLGSSYNNIGAVYQYQGNYPKALKNYFVALKLKQEIGDKHGIAGAYNNIGIVYDRQGNYPEALKNHFAALKLWEETGDKWGIALSYNSIGNVYYSLGNYSEALKNHFASLKLNEEIDNKQGIANSYDNIGLVYHDQCNYPEALKYHFASLKLSEEKGDKRGIAASYNNIGHVYDNQGNYSEALQNHFAALKLRKEIGEKPGIGTSYNNIGTVYQKQGNYPAAVKNHFAALQLSEETGDKDLMKDSSLSLFSTYKTTGDFETALKYHERYHAVESEILGERSQEQLTNLNFMHNLEQKEKDLEIEHLRNVELKQEKDRSESLLLNILPAEVAEELKQRGTAKAKLFDDVTVMFADFVSFTKVSERLTPQQLVDELHVCFSAFDEIMGRNSVEKIKTVGDAYLAVSGLPVANTNHAADVIDAAIDIRTFMRERKKEKGENTFEIRIGAHSGPVVAGIVGIKKFAYDIWGDTVNTAARMEQSSEAGKINISQTTYDLVKDKFNCFSRGEIEAKNKGRLGMYFVA